LAIALRLPDEEKAEASDDDEFERESEEVIARTVLILQTSTMTPKIAAKYVHKRRQSTAKIKAASAHTSFSPPTLLYAPTVNTAISRI